MGAPSEPFSWRDHKAKAVAAAALGVLEQALMGLRPVLGADCGPGSCVEPRP